MLKRSFGRTEVSPGKCDAHSVAATFPKVIAVAVNNLRRGRGRKPWLLAPSMSSTPSSSGRRFLLPFAAHDSSTIGLGGGNGNGSAKVVRKSGAVLLRESEGLFEVGRGMGGRSFAGTDVLPELIMLSIIHEPVSMEVHAHIIGRAKKVRGKGCFHPRNYMAVLPQ